eukprot:gene12040-biopygen3019
MGSQAQAYAASYSTPSVVLTSHEPLAALHGRWANVARPFPANPGTLLGVKKSRRRRRAWIPRKLNARPIPSLTAETGGGMTERGAAENMTASDGQGVGN